MERIIFSLVFLSLLFSCGDGDQNNVTDGDLDREPDIEESSSVCGNGDLGCSEAQVIVCKNGRWEVLEDCADHQMTCELGLCANIVIDGDDDLDKNDNPEIEEAELEPPPDTSPPVVVSTTPADQSSTVDPASMSGSAKDIQINFNEKVVVNNFTFQRDVLFYGGCSSILYTGDISNDGRQIYMNLGSTLQHGSTYHVSIAKDVLKDSAGNLFEGYKFSFSTLGDADGDCELELEDTHNPEVDTTFPSNGKTDVALDITYINIFFTEALKVFDWATASKITIAGDDGHAPAFSAEWLENNTHLKITLTEIASEKLHPGKTYTVTLKDGLIDYAQNPLGEYSFWFTAVL